MMYDLLVFFFYRSQLQKSSEHSDDVKLIVVTTMGSIDKGQLLRKKQRHPKTLINETLLNRKNPFIKRVYGENTKQLRK